MTIEEATVRHVAHLARLRLTDEECGRLRAELGAILSYFERLRELDLTGAEPLAHVGGFANPLRPDEPRPPAGAEAALGAAPEARDGFFIVPPVIE